VQLKSNDGASNGSIAAASSGDIDVKCSTTECGIVAIRFRCVTMNGILRKCGSRRRCCV